MSTNFEAAQQWARKGYNVAPQKAVDRKHPGVEWRMLQDRRVTPEELQSWRPMFDNGVGFITGGISRVIVIESDGPEGEAVLAEFDRLHGPLPNTLTIRSGSGRGLHRHFRHPGHQVKTVANTSIKLDVKGDKGYCVLPPSLHKSGGRYTIEKDCEPAPLPAGLLEFIAQKAAEASGTASPAHDPVKRLSVPAHASASEGNIAPPFLPLPSVENMRAMLRHLAARNCFEGRKAWIEAGMALKLAYGDEVGSDLWAETHIDSEARADAPDQWASFAAKAQPGHVTIGTIIKAATDAGFAFAQSTAPALATERESGAERITGYGADVKNGQVFASMFQRKLLHIYETGEWLRFTDEQGWVSPPPGEADRAAKEALAAMRAYAATRYKDAPDDPKTKRLIAHVERTSRAQNLRAMIEMAKSEKGMMVRLSDFDDDPWLLGVRNGVLDLRSGALLPTSPDVLVSKRCNVVFDPAAKCPRFVQFLKEVQPEKEMAELLLRLLGYCLTGDVGAQVFAFLYGHGANGKSVLIELMAWLLGDYARKIQTDMLMQHQRNPQGPSPDIVGLKGVRLAFANETEEGRRLAEARVKDLTGGDTLTGRLPYGKADIAFRPTHKLFIVGNHKPEIADISFGMWRRVSLIPFEQTISEERRDPRLLEALKLEGAGILNVALLGLQDVRRSGLSMPAKIRAATAAYRDEQDILAEWIGESCDAGGGCTIQKTVLYTDYRLWAERNGHRPLSQSKLTRRLNDRGYRVAPDKRTVIGLSLRADVARRAA